MLDSINAVVEDLAADALVSVVTILQVITGKLGLCQEQRQSVWLLVLLVLFRLLLIIVICGRLLVVAARRG